MELDGRGAVMLTLLVAALGVSLWLRWRKGVRAEVQWLQKDVTVRTAKDVPFLVCCRPPPKADLVMNYKVIFSATQQVCAEGVGFVGVVDKVNLSKTGFGSYRLEVQIQSLNLTLSADIEKRIASFEEEAAKARASRPPKEPVMKIPGWPQNLPEDPGGIRRSRGWSKMDPRGAGPKSACRIMAPGRGRIRLRC
ncbi:unnamed protein product [Cladocopium goreaui]|uniref:Uncharacterized protein n=1 Tax=Cladocopium goreaui TaxID=2562237 RepID=A0A9P1CXX9_9DINO|nr:unnamed protein product [Cladocopium goreaui]